jgi:hypothetical protein
MGDGVRVRIPLLEGLGSAILSGASFGDRPLTPNERELLLSIFGDSVNLDPILIGFTRLISSGTGAYTMGNKILIPAATMIDAPTLVHEMTHVWQYQTRGTRYISDSALHQLTQGKSAYAVTIVPGRSIYDYAAEQQAVIVEYYYRDSPAGFRANPDVQSMINEVQKARPLSNSDIVNETWFGSGRGPLDTSYGGGAPQLSPTVPLLRITW